MFFSLEDHLLVYVPRLLAHLLDVGPTHEPCCHVMASDTSEAITTECDKLIHLVPLIYQTNQVVIVLLLLLLYYFLRSNQKEFLINFLFV